jgi:hypothetical protein
LAPPAHLGTTRDAISCFFRFATHHVQ